MVVVVVVKMREKKMINHHLPSPHLPSHVIGGFQLDGVEDIDENDNSFLHLGPSNYLPSHLINHHHPSSHLTISSLILPPSHLLISFTIS